MKKLLLVLLVAFPVAQSYAGNVNVERVSGSEDITKHVPFLKPDAQNRLVLSPEELTGLKAAREKMATPATRTVDPKEMELKAMIEANELRIRNVSEQIANRVELNRIRQQEETRKPVDLLEDNIDAPKMAAPHDRPNQWGEPYQAFGDNVVLKGEEMYGASPSGEETKYGDAIYLYDAEGNEIGYEVTMSNKDKYAQRYWGFSYPVPENAIVKIIYNRSDDGETRNSFYIDPVSKKKVDLQISSYKYYNGYTVESYNKYLNKDGVMVSNINAESEYDGEGRPVLTTYYTSVWDSIQAQYVRVKYRKNQYEYLGNGLTTLTVINSNRDIYGDTLIWTPISKNTTGYNQEGEYCYESMYYDSETGWYGSNKYNRFISEDESEERYTYWSWNWDTKEWVGSYKRNYRYNSKGNTINNDYYRYSEELSDFYIYNKRGYEYQGDTLLIGQWNIYYKTPETKEQLSHPESLIYSSSKVESVPYTKEELGWPFGENPNLYTPTKSEISYYLDSANNWVPDYKREYEYVLAKPYGDDYARIYTSSQKEYSWVAEKSAWSEPYETRYAYDEYGNRTLYEAYSNGSITERSIREYVYFFPDQDHDWLTYYEAKNEYWYRYSNDEELVCRYRNEWKYDRNRRCIEEVSYSRLDNATNKWQDGYKYEYAYDSEGNRTLSVYYSLNTETGAWVGERKYEYEYDRFGEQSKSVYYYSSGTDDSGNTIWCGSYYQETVRDDAGRTIMTLNYSNWDSENNRWSYGSKEEWTYSPSGLNTGYVSSGYYNGEWTGNSKYSYEYNDDGAIITWTGYSFDSWETHDWYISRKTDYTYTESGELKDTYVYYGQNGGVLTPYEKQVAQFDSDGRITGYMDSTYYAGTWSPSVKVEYSKDEAGNQIVLSSTWSSWEDAWVYDSKYIQQLDESGNVLVSENYRWNGEDWYGSGKEEHAYNAAGKAIMTATYYWDDNRKAWIGSNKSEYDEDSFGRQILYAYYYWSTDSLDWYGNYKSVSSYDENGNQTMYAYYYWNYEHWDWYGSGKNEYSYDKNGNQTMSAYYEWDSDNWRWRGESKSERKYDSNGNQIMYAYYSGMDSDGNWIGNNKRYDYYDSDSVYHYEYYYWDYDRNDWYGNYKYDSYSSDNKRVQANYEWDYDAWCWVGTSKTEYEYLDDGDINTRYEWDAENKKWVGTEKTKYQYEYTELCDKNINTYYRWNDETNWWIYSKRETGETKYRSDYNLDYSSWKYEEYDAETSSWKLTGIEKEVYVYTFLTVVDDITYESSIRVVDGTIMVSCEDNVLIEIVSASGAKIASGQGEVSAQVAPGTYLVVVGNKTVKVMVR